MIILRNVTFYLISSMVSGFFIQLQIFWVQYLMELLEPLTVLALLNCSTWHIQGFRHGLLRLSSSRAQVLWNLRSDFWSVSLFSVIEGFGWFRKGSKNITAKSIFLIGIPSMQDWIVTIRHGGTRKRSRKRLKHTGNLLRRNLQLIGVC